MTKEFEDRGTTYSIHENVNIGEVKVADEVVAIIAGLAATEVEGVDSLGGNITSEIVSKLGMKNLSKGVKVTVEESSVQSIQHCLFLFLFISNTIQWKTQFNLNKVCFFIHAKSSLYNRLLDIAKTTFQKQLTSKSTVF